MHETVIIQGMVKPNQKDIMKITERTSRRISKLLQKSYRKKKNKTRMWKK